MKSQILNNLYKSMEELEIHKYKSTFIISLEYRDTKGIRKTQKKFKGKNR